MINSKVNNNYDMQTLMNIVGQNAITTTQISQQLGIVTNSINAVRSDIDTLK